jgi:hypothetical protein
MTVGSLLAARAVSLVVCIEEKGMGKIRLCGSAFTDKLHFGKGKEQLFLYMYEFPTNK